MADKDYVMDNGLTAYPKWVDHPEKKDKSGHPVRVIVKTPEEETKLTGKKAAVGGWDNKDK